MLVADGRVPRSWIPPRQVCELRALLQLYRDLAEEHTARTQRIHATLFRQGVPSLAGRLGDPQVRARLAADGAEMGLSPAGAQAVAVALRRMDDLEAGLGPCPPPVPAAQCAPAAGTNLAATGPDGGTASVELTGPHR